MEFSVGALCKVKLLQHRSCMVDNFIATSNTTTHVHSLLHKRLRTFHHAQKQTVATVVTS